MAATDEAPDIDAESDPDSDSSGDQSYRARLGAVLRRRDPSALRGFLLENARVYGDSAQVAEVEQTSPYDLEVLLHRMIVARPDLADLQRASREWLFKQGLDSYGPSAPRRN